MKVGIDIEKISRFKLPRNSLFLEKYFADSEISYAYGKSKPEMHLCGIFCAKEAVKKAINLKGISMKDIKIEHGENGMPMVILRNNLFKRLPKILLSISHCEDYAVASSIVTENGG